MRGLLLTALLASACSFTPGSFRPNVDAGPDGPPPITVGFANAANTTDEEAGTAQVRVILSQVATDPITVSFAVTGGTASRPSDFLLNDGTLTFAPGDIEETIDITIGPDGMAEPDETIVLTLANATGADLAIDTHTLTIGMNTLPRVTFSVPTSADDETVAAPAVNIVLDKASTLTTSVEVTIMAGTATGGGVDYTLSSSTVTFNPGVVSVPIPIAVEDDKIDEDAETITVELTSPTNIVVGTQSTTTHTINDEDPEPTVSFAAGQRVNEGIGTANIAVTLSSASGKTVSVPFSVNNLSTATGGGTDYTITTASPLSFSPGTTTQNIAVSINNDTLAEPTETLILDLGAPTNATAAAPTSHTLGINDNDSTCLGPDATAFSVCFATPSNTVTINANFNTDSSGLCSPTPPISGWTGQPNSCFIVAQTINVSGNSIVTGSRPLVLFATGNISFTATLDVSGHGTTGGAGAGIGCSAYTDIPSNDTSGAGGGAGGSFRTAGGNGGQGNGASGSGGSAVAATSGAPATLRGGCAGQNGGDGFGGGGSTGGIGGGGGGAVYVVAGGTISVASGVGINVSGGGADAVTSPDSGLFGGGGGGGAGGMLRLHATTYSVSGGRFMANGGGGSSGADDNDPGTDGSDTNIGSPTAGGAGGPVNNGGGIGGGGFGTTSAVGGGGNGGSNNGGGGGGGGGGYIGSNLALTGATVSAGDIDP